MTQKLIAFVLLFLLLAVAALCQGSDSGESTGVTISFTIGEKRVIGSVTGGKGKYVCTKAIITETSIGKNVTANDCKPQNHLPSDLCAMTLKNKEGKTDEKGTKTFEGILYCDSDSTTAKFTELIKDHEFQENQFYAQVKEKDNVVFDIFWNTTTMQCITSECEGKKLISITAPATAHLFSNKTEALAIVETKESNVVYLAQGHILSKGDTTRPTFIAKAGEVIVWERDTPKDLNGNICQETRTTTVGEYELVTASGCNEETNLPDNICAVTQDPTTKNGKLYCRIGSTAKFSKLFKAPGFPYTKSFYATINEDSAKHGILWQKNVLSCITKDCRKSNSAVGNVQLLSDGNGIILIEAIPDENTLYLVNGVTLTPTVETATTIIVGPDNEIIWEHNAKVTGQYSCKTTTITHNMSSYTSIRAEDCTKGEALSIDVCAITLQDSDATSGNLYCKFGSPAKFTKLIKTESFEAAKPFYAHGIANTKQYDILWKNSKLSCFNGCDDEFKVDNVQFLRLAGGKDVIAASHTNNLYLLKGFSQGVAISVENGKSYSLCDGERISHFRIDKNEFFVTKCDSTFNCFNLENIGKPGSTEFKYKFGDAEILYSKEASVVAINSAIVGHGTESKCMFLGGESVFCLGKIINEMNVYKCNTNINCDSSTCAKFKNVGEGAQIENLLIGQDGHLKYKTNTEIKNPQIHRSENLLGISENDILKFVYHDENIYVHPSAKGIETEGATALLCGENRSDLEICKITNIKMNAVPHVMQLQEGSTNNEIFSDDKDSKILIFNRKMDYIIANSNGVVKRENSLWRDDNLLAANVDNRFYTNKKPTIFGGEECKSTVLPDQILDKFMWKCSDGTIRLSSTLEDHLSAKKLEAGKKTAFVAYCSAKANNNESNAFVSENGGVSVASLGNVVLAVSKDDLMTVFNPDVQQLPTYYHKYTNMTDCLAPKIQDQTNATMTFNGNVVANCFKIGENRLIMESAPSKDDKWLQLCDENNVFDSKCEGITVGTKKCRTFLPAHFKFHANQVYSRSQMCDASENSEFLTEQGLDSKKAEGAVVDVTIVRENENVVALCKEKVLYSEGLSDFTYSNKVAPGSSNMLFSTVENVASMMNECDLPSSLNEPVYTVYDATTNSLAIVSKGFVFSTSTVGGSHMECSNSLDVIPKPNAQVFGPDVSGMMTIVDGTEINVDTCEETSDLAVSCKKINGLNVYMRDDVVLAVKLVKSSISKFKIAIIVVSAIATVGVIAVIGYLLKHKKPKRTDFFDDGI